MDKINKSLVLVFLDEGGKAKNITIKEPKDNVNINEIKNFADIITTKKLVEGKVGHLKTLQGAYMVTRETRAVE
ncbi:DUF2922 domain-containing protein [Peptoniphilus vaginalis]|uniref:DUF2922 domain-containing protein n=1 Tax=Peptoniphilus vaginalis TaxID=1756987 RepID=UPI0023F75DE4|nr:DUF2922 domain-containing protein [Peptoniphilus vaginalis]